MEKTRSSRNKRARWGLCRRVNQVSAQCNCASALACCGYDVRFVGTAMNQRGAAELTLVTPHFAFCNFRWRSPQLVLPQPPRIGPERARNIGGGSCSWVGTDSRPCCYRIQIHSMRVPSCRSDLRCGQRQARPGSRWKPSMQEILIQVS